MSLVLSSVRTDKGGHGAESWALAGSTAPLGEKQEVY